MTKKDEQRFTISESNTTWIMKTLDRIRGDMTRSDACLKLLAYLLQTPDSCKAIMTSDLTPLPPLPEPIMPIPTIDSSSF